MGTVYEARHRELDRAVAPKLLPKPPASVEDALRRFKLEIRAVGQLDHPNVVRPTDAGEHDGVPYLKMDLMDGVDLFKVLPSCGTPRGAEVIEIAAQAAHGLAPPAFARPPAGFELRILVGDSP